jgi:aryl-alcohol dehydrogenase-like predicted oxidoreductase
MTQWSRRSWLGWSVGALSPTHLAWLYAQEKMMNKPIPSTGERLPVIGLGGSSTFSQAADSEYVVRLRQVMMMLVQHGGKVFDTAPDYGASEKVAGRIAHEALITDQIFWATKVNAEDGNGKADPVRTRAQLEASCRKIRKRTIDLVQVHNLRDPLVQLKVLEEFQAKNRVRYIGVTTTLPEQYDELFKIMDSEPLDFIGINYAVDDRGAEKAILPLALDRQCAVLAYAPFGRTRLFRRVGNRPVPDWAAEFDATTWAQFFLKFVVAHPAITAATPATSVVKDMLDNIGGGLGRLPDDATRKRMAAFVDALPSA